LNVYPAILAALHQAGFNWETAGKLWGVIIGSLTVLPLFGLVRRQFDDRIAFLAAIIYALHAEMIRWAPEGIRDPTFWFFWMTTLYFQWRAAQEANAHCFLAAGVSMALAALTRFEGLLLLIPMVCWFICAQTGNRRKMIVGGIVALLVLPLLLFLVSKIWFPYASPWELFRTKPLEIVDHWWHGHAAPSSGNVPSIELYGKQWANTSAYLAALVKGATPWYLLLLAAGVWCAWRRCLSLDLMPLWLASAAFMLAIWIHLYVAEETSKRYFLPIVLMTTPLAAMGVQAIANVRHIPHCAPLALYAALALGNVITTDYRHRSQPKIVGEMIAQHCQSAPTILGPPGIVGLVAYYANGQPQVFPSTATTATIEALCRENASDWVLFPNSRDAAANENMVLGMRRDGFDQIDNVALVSGNQRIGVFVRRNLISP
jgi:4-amino-4-deoxy-L-arabinose transferase-like glycosyltransferase